MKHITFILLCTLSINSYGNGSGAPDSANDEQDSTEIYITNIRAEYQKINASKLRVVDAEAQDESSEGGEVKKYYDSRGLRKVVAEYMGAIGRAKWEYYFSGDELCFAYEVDYTYDKPMSGHVIKKEENRYYFHHRRMIRWIDEKGRIRDKDLYADKARDILNDKDIR